MIARVLAIAGSDSGGGAGIQADIKTITMLGGHAMTAVTAITAQNTAGVDAILPVPTAMVLAQIDAVARDIGVDAIKIGMIGSAAVADAVAERLGRPDLAGVPMVFDPVMVASSGARLSDLDSLPHLRRLVERAAVSTPNVEELGALAGIEIGGIGEIDDVAGRLVHLGSILVTGIGVGKQMVEDRLFWLEEGVGRALNRAAWSDARIDTRHDHGTGCTLSSAIATGLATGLSLPNAITRARAYVRAALLAAPGLGQGHGPMGHGLGQAWV